MPRYEAHILKNWQSAGLTRVVVARTRDEGWVEAGVFLIDSFCLGVKDALLCEFAAVDWPLELNRILPADERIAMHPACARKFIEGAVAYAGDLGIAPHRDYRKARRAFGSVSASDCPETFTYGDNGKPLFIAGPHDDEERIERVLRLLTAKLGPEGFHFILPQEEDDLGYAVSDQDVADFFAAHGRPDDRYVLGGMCAAVSLSQPDIEAEDMIPILWTGNPPPSWPEDKEIELGDLINYVWCDTEDRFDFAKNNRSQSHVLPSFADNPSIDEAEWRSRARAWSRGFLRAVRAWPAEWVAVMDRPDLRRSIGLIVATAEERETDPRVYPIQPAERLAAEIGTALLAIHAVFLPEETE